MDHAQKSIYMLETLKWEAKIYETKEQLFCTCTIPTTEGTFSCWTSILDAIPMLQCLGLANK